MLLICIEEKTEDKEEVNGSQTSEPQVNETEKASSERVEENESVMDKESEVTETNTTNPDEGNKEQTSKPDEPVKEENEEEKMEETKEQEGKKEEKDKPDTPVVKDEPQDDTVQKEGDDSGVGAGDESGVSPGDDSGVGPSELGESSKASGGGDSTDVLSGMDWQDGVASLEGSDMKVSRILSFEQSIATYLLDDVDIRVAPGRECGSSHLAKKIPYPISPSDTCSLCIPKLFPPSI